MHRGLALFVNNVAVLQAVDAATGELRWRHRLPGPCWASASGAGQYAYFCWRALPDANLAARVESEA